MQIIQKKSSKTLSILKSFQGSGTLFYKLFVFYIVNSNISCFCFYAVIMACKHTALYTNPASCFCLFYGRLRRFPLHTLLLLHNLQKNSACYQKATAKSHSPPLPFSFCCERVKSNYFFTACAVFLTVCSV